MFEVARAKINLSLDVLGKRTDGYHEVEMVMQTIDLCDHLTLTRRDDDRIQLISTAGFVPTDERNLAFQAASLLAARMDVKGRGVTIHLDKRIPVAAGLAGGSSDAAAVLRGLNKLWELRLSPFELAHIGAEIGSDVPFCVYGGTAVARGRGELLEPLETRPSFWVILAKPALAVSTADVYAALDITAITEHPRAETMVAALREGAIGAVAAALGNVLEIVTFQKHPEVARLKDQMLRLGAQAALMSGSGPTVFGLTEREQRAKRIYNELRRSLKEVYLCHTC